MKKHTPGPWFAFVWDKTKKPKTWVIGARIDEGNQQFLDHLCEMSHGAAKEDAHLIAAAPLLLSCLEDIVNSEELLSSHEGSEKRKKEADEKIERAKKAILLAKGYL